MKKKVLREKLKKERELTVEEPKKNKNITKKKKENK